MYLSIYPWSRVGLGLGLGLFVHHIYIYMSVYVLTDWISPLLTTTSSQHDCSTPCRDGSTMASSSRTIHAY